MTGRVKKLFGLLLCMVLLVCLMPVSAMADEAPTVTQAPTAIDGLVYTGSELALVNAGTASQGVMQYSLDNSTWSDSIPKAVNAKEYTVYYKAVNSSQQSDVGSITARIACANVAYSVDSPTGLKGTYGQSLSSVELPVYTDGVAGKWSWTAPGLKLEPVNTAGVSFMAVFTPDNSNLYAPKSQKVLVKVNPAELTVSGTGTASGEYGSRMSELTIEGLTVKSGSIEVAGKWAFADTVDGDAIPAVGDTKMYDVVFTPEDSNYGTKTAEVTLSISPKKVTVTGLKAIDREYDGTTDVKLDITGAKLEGVLDGDVVTLTGGSAKMADTSAGKNKAVTVSGLALAGEDKGNYSLVVPTDLKVNISKYVVTCTGITVDDKVYDGKTDATYTGTLSEGKLPPNLNCSISDTATVSFKDPNVGEDKALIISGITVQDGTSVDITKNFEFIASVTASITPKTVTVTPDSGLSKTYGYADPGLIGFNPTGLVGTDALTGKLSRQSGENVGTYRITAGTLANPNYEISLTEAYFTINPLQLTSSNTTVTVKDYVYDGASHDGFVSAKLGDKELVEGTDFTVKGAEAYTLGSHKLTIEGKGNYTGSVTATWKLSLPAIAEKVTDGTITAGNVLTDLTADKIRELVVLDEALAGIKDNADATEVEKQDAAAVAADLKPIIDALEGKANDIVDPIKKWLEENLPKADADELEMRKEYEELQTWLKGDGKVWAEVVDANLGKELEKMKEKLYTYVIIVGNGSHWLTTSSDDLGFRANGALKLFSYVKIDGKVPERDSYTLYHGSTIVMLHNDYLKTLDKGWHEIQFVYSDGVSNVGKFQVTDRWVDVATGDESDMGLWLGFMLMAGLGMAVCVPRLVRRKNEN